MIILDFIEGILTIINIILKFHQSSCFKKYALKNTQFLSNFYETWSKCSTRELVILTKLQNNQFATPKDEHF